jgi:carbonic anhydrase/acetyltransferase-like protein (isoleucine patch superfamily)
MYRRSLVRRHDFPGYPDFSKPRPKPHTGNKEIEWFPDYKMHDELVPTTLNFKILYREYVPGLRRICAGLTGIMKWAAWHLIHAPNSLIPDRPKEEFYKMRRVMTVDGKTPQIGDNCFVAPCAGVYGDVKLARKNFIGYNTVIRAESGNRIEIGESSNIQDKAIVVGTCHIGKWVSIEPMAVIDHADVASNSMVGAAAIVMKGAKIESGCILCAASVLKSGEVVKSGEIWAGNPAQKIGELTEKEKDSIIAAAKHHVLLALEHYDSWSLSWEDWENIRLSREIWAIHSTDSREYRIRPNYTREPPSPKSRRGGSNITPHEAAKGTIGSLPVPDHDSVHPGNLA